ncbi:MAG: type I-U CRISPR-associated RAMP protein Csb1/Cas7u [Planctomycetia bacterium]|nr:type I-U CRISPR-associated RAMP protein Csb1/Cas7u [Planctomycetia bacterium]
MSETKTLDYQQLREAVSGQAAAVRCVTEYQPAGGPGDKVFPPTYKDGKNTTYANESRRINGKDVPCVLLDSVQSQANRMEMALLDAWEQGRIKLPVLIVDFAGNDLPKTLRITSLDAPHRIADALLRDSLLEGERFRESKTGERLDHVDNRNATALFELCPTALVFGMWDSTGPRGGLGAKFARAMVSEIVGIQAVSGVKTSSRIDPAQISSRVTIYHRNDPGGGMDWTSDPDDPIVVKDRKGQPLPYNRSGSAQGEPGNPSKANHSNVLPTIGAGGITIDKAQQTTVLSLPALRRLRFPINGKTDPKVDDAARTVLAALGLVAAAAFQEQGCDLRSRCQLVPVNAYQWELVGKPGDPPKPLTISAETAIKVYEEAVAAAQKVGLPWMEEALNLTPSPELVALVKKSQELAAKIGAEEGDE